MSELEIKILANPQQALDETRLFVSTPLKAIRGFKITNHDESAKIAEYVKGAKARAKALVEKKKALIDPLKAAVKGIEELFRPALDECEEFERLGKSAIAEFTDRLNAARDAELRAASEAFASGNVEQGQASLVVASTAVVAPPAGVSVRKIWDFVVENPALVPREFCAPHDPTIRAFGKTHPTEGPAPVVPGVRFFTKDSTTVRS